MIFSSIDKTAKSITKTAPVFSSLLISTAIFCYAGSADAQLVDYGSLQSLFGEPVTTSATGVPQRTSDVPVDMTIITADDIRHSGTRSIPQIIGLYVPGVDVLRTSETSYDIGIRGYQQPFQSNLLVLVDGRQVFVDDYSRTIWDNIPVNVDDIRQIEVVKGASSAFSSLFGSNAGDGVINIITYSPLYDKNNVANVTVGTQENISGDATGTVKGENWGSKFSVGGMNAEEFNTSQSQNILLDSPDTRPMHSYVANSSVFQLDPKFQINTDMNYSESRANPADIVDGAVIANQKTTSYSMRGGFNWQSPVGVITNNNYFNSNESLLSEPSGNGFGYDQETELFVSQLQDQFTVGTQHTFRVGLEYRYQNFVYGYGDELDPISPDLKENNYSANGLWLWQITDKLSLTNAIRFDSQRMYEAGQLWQFDVIPLSDFNHTNNVWSGNSGIVYHLTDQDTIGANYGRGVILPSMIELGGNILQNYYTFGPTDGEGNPDLKPTIVENYELDYTHKFPSLFSSMRVSPYYTYTKDIVGPYSNGNFTDPVDGNGTTFIPLASLNAGASTAYGGEIEIKGNKDGYRWDASYSLAHVDDQPELITYLIKYENSSPESHVRLLAGYTVGSWEFDANGQWLSSTDMLRMTNTPPTVVPEYIGDYYSFGGRIGYTISDHFTLALTGTNISQYYTQESPYPAAEQQIFLSLTGKF